MPKPTLLQSILGRPSQTYYHPTEHEYHSTRDELFKIARATRFIPGQFDDSGVESTTPGNSDNETCQSHPTPRPTSSRHSLDVAAGRGQPAIKQQVTPTVSICRTLSGYNWRGAYLPPRRN